MTAILCNSADIYSHIFSHIVVDLGTAITVQGSNSKFTPLAAKLTAKYYISFDFRPVAMEFSPGHLALCNCIYLSGCSRFKQVGTRSNQLDLVPVHMV